MQLTFSEHVSASLGGVRVVDSSGHRVDRGAVRVRGPIVEVDLAPHLPKGTYVVSYRIISADGHPVRGALVFGVGSGKVDVDAARKVNDSGNDLRWQEVGAVGRFFAYGGVLLAAGGGLFLVLAHRTGRERATLVRQVRVAALVGALGSLVALPVQAALGTGQGPGSLFDHGRAEPRPGRGRGPGAVAVPWPVCCSSSWPSTGGGSTAAGRGAGRHVVRGHRPRPGRGHGPPVDHRRHRAPARRRHLGGRPRPAVLDAAGPPPAGGREPRTRPR